MTRARRAPDRPTLATTSESAHVDVTETTEPLPEMWERQPNETEVAYQAFTLYLAQPASRRSQTRVAADRGTSVRHVAQWSSDNLWPERASAWDRHQLELLAAEARDALISMRTRHAQIASVALSKVVDRLQDMNARDMTVRDMTALLDVAVKIERLSRGESSVVLDVGPHDQSSPRTRPASASTETLESFIAALAESGVIGDDPVEP